MTERTIITFNNDGTFRGASSQDFNGDLVPLDADALASFAPSLALASQLTSSREMLTAAREELTALQSKVAATTAAVKLAFDADDIPAMLAIAADFVTPEQEKERLADLAKAVEFETQAAELRAKHP